MRTILVVFALRWYGTHGADERWRSALGTSNADVCIRVCVYIFFLQISSTIQFTIVYEKGFMRMHQQCTGPHIFTAVMGGAVHNRLMPLSQRLYNFTRRKICAHDIIFIHNGPCRPGSHAMPREMWIFVRPEVNR